MPGISAGYQQLTVRMIDRGHRDIAVLWGETDVTSVRDRLAGHRRALRDRGLPELPERSGPHAFKRLAAVARQRRLRALLGTGESVSALLFGNAPTLALAVSDLLAMDVDFPGSVELASMDQSGGILPMSVVSARLPTREMGRTAARLAHERVEGSTEPARHVVLPGRGRGDEPGPQPARHRRRSSRECEASSALTIAQGSNTYRPPTVRPDLQPADLPTTAPCPAHTVRSSVN